MVEVDVVVAIEAAFETEVVVASVSVFVLVVAPVLAAELEAVN